MADEFQLITGGGELLDRIEPLWLQLRGFHADSWPRWAAELNSVSFPQRKAGLLEYVPSGLLVVLAIVDDADVGYCVNTIDRNGKGEVSSLFVVARHRRLGIGHALMGASLDWFAERGITSLAVNVLCDNSAAVRFYERYGFLSRTVTMNRLSGGR